MSNTSLWMLIDFYVADMQRRGCTPDSITTSKQTLQRFGRALIFDSYYDSYKGIIAYVRVLEGQIHHRATFYLTATRISGEAIEIGTFSPQMTPTGRSVAA